MRLDKETGKDAGRLNSAGRSPSFRLDWVTGVVVAEHDGVLAGYRFPSTPEK